MIGRYNIDILCYNDISEHNNKLLKNLLASVWEGINCDIHPKTMNATSFCAIDNKVAIGYTGVVSWDITVRNETFKMCGLSCVCTHPEHRGKGIGRTLVKKATEWIVQNSAFDIGLFTCTPQNSDFYDSIGIWEKSPDLTLKESDREGALASDVLHLDVFKLLISQKAKQHFAKFQNTAIVLNFPKGHFI